MSYCNAYHKICLLQTNVLGLYVNKVSLEVA